MTGKPRSRFSSRRTIELSSDVTMENTVLRSKNLDLAKGLSECKQKYAQVTKENMSLRSKLFEAESQIMKLTEAIIRIESCGKYGVTKLLSFTEDIYRILQEAAQFTYCANELNHAPMEDVSLNNHKCDSKTRAVKPMVSGHTIVRPTITLQRVTTEQLEQLRNSSITSDNVNTNESSSPHVLQNGHTNLLTSDRTSPFNNEEATDEAENEEEEEEIVDDNANEQSETYSPNFERLSTLQEESIENSSRNNNSSRLASNISNFQQSPIFQETRVNISRLSESVISTPRRSANYSSPHLNLASDYTMGLHPLSVQRNTSLTPTIFPPERINNPHVMLHHLPRDMLSNFSASNKENISGNSSRNSSGSMNSSTKFLHVPTHKTEIKKTRHSEMSSYEVSHDASILNDMTENRLHTRTSDVSTVVNISFESSKLSGLRESTGNLSPLNKTNNAIEQQVKLSKHNEFKNKNNTNEVSAENRMNSTGSYSYDPLEGPSNLLDNTNHFQQKLKLLNKLGLSPNGNTSTPYSHSKVTLRRNRFNSINTPYTPGLLEQTMFKKRFIQDEFSPVGSLKTSRRRKNILDYSPSPLKVSSINIKPDDDDDDLAHYTNCSVNITQLPLNILSQNLENMPERSSLGRKSSPFKTKKSEQKRKLKSKSSTVTVSPRKRRPRAHVPGALKEPSLAKKLRRSK